MKPVAVEMKETLTILSLMERSLLTFGKLTEADKTLAKTLYESMDDGEKSVVGYSHSKVIEQIEATK